MKSILAIPRLAKASCITNQIKINGGFFSVSFKNLCSSIKGCDGLVRSDIILLKDFEQIMQPFKATPKISVNRSRRRALIMLGGIAFGFLTMNQIALYRYTRTQERDDMPPHFAIDLDSASQAELRLLPSVGVKTAERWEMARTHSTYLKPQSQSDLEKLPQVGPKRAQQLAPHLLETGQ